MLKCWPTWSACIHWKKKQTLVFLIHAHFAVTTVAYLVKKCILSNHFFQQNKLTITFNKMITYLQANLIDLISTLPTTKMSCMLKHFRFCVSAGVELLCLIGEWRPQCNCVTVNNRPEIIYGLYNLCNRPVKRLILVARLPRPFYIGPHAGWNYGIVTPFL